MYVEPSIRPKDGRYAENPYRLQHYYQAQVVLKPAEDVLDQYFGSLEAIGIDTVQHDVRLVEDDWEGPTLGAWGLGWEVWCDGMEITGFTYFQQVGGLELDLIPAEITYGLERLAMFMQGVDSVWDVDLGRGVTYADVYGESERSGLRTTSSTLPSTSCSGASPSTRPSARPCSTRICRYLRTTRC